MIDIGSLLFSIYQCNSNVLQLAQSKQIGNTIVQMLIVSVKNNTTLLLDEIINILNNQLSTVSINKDDNEDDIINNSNSSNNSRDDYILFLFILLAEITSISTTTIFSIKNDNTTSICNNVINYFIKQSSDTEVKISNLDEKVSLLARLVVSLSVKDQVDDGASSEVTQSISSTLLDVILQNDGDHSNESSNRFLQRYSLGLLNELLQSSKTFSLLDTKFLEKVLNNKLFPNLKSQNSLIRSNSLQAIELIISGGNNNNSNNSNSNNISNNDKSQKKNNKQQQQKQKQQQQNTEPQQEQQQIKSKEFEKYQQIWLEQLYLAILQQQSDVNERLKLFFRFQKLFINSILKNNLQQQSFNILSKAEFFKVLFVSLIDTDNVPRKQALHLLKIFISLPPISWQTLLPFNSKQWTLYFSLYESFNETKSHLFRPVWAQLSRLITPNSSFATIDDHTKSCFWIVILIHRGFTHINPNIRRRVIVDLLTTESMDMSEAIASGKLELSTILKPLLNSIDGPDFVVQQHTPTTANSNNQPPQQQHPSVLRKRELFEFLAIFLEKTLELMGSTEQASEFFDRLVGLISMMSDVNGMVMMFGIIISLVRSTKTGTVKINIGDSLIEKFRLVLETHPIPNAPSNTYLYQRILVLLCEMNQPDQQSQHFKQNCVKILSLYPKSMIDESFTQLSKMLNNSNNTEWIYQYLIERLPSINQHVEIEDYPSLARLFKFLDKYEQIIDYKTKLLSTITVDSLLLIESILKESPAILPLEEVFTTQTINEINNQFNSYFNNQQQQDSTTAANDQLHFRKLETLVDFMSRQKKSFSELAQSCKTMLTSKSSYDIRQITLMLLVWQRCHLASYNKEVSRAFLLELLQLKVERGAGSTLTLPKLLEYRWLCILDLLRVSVDSADADQEEVEEFETICQLVFEYGLDTLDNATPNSLASIFDTLLLTIVRGKLVVTPSQAVSLNQLELPVLKNEEEMTRLFQLAYRAFSDCSRKSLVIVSSFINLLFHPLYFHCKTTIPLVKEYLGKTLNEWGESVRISCGLLGHCCGIWSTHLTTLDNFLDDIIDLCLLTTEDSDQLKNNNSVEIFNNTGSTTDVQDQHQFKMSSNHGYIVRWFVSQLNETSEQSDIAVRFVQKLMLSLLELNIEGELSQREYSQQSKTNKQKCRLWRTLCSLTHVDKVFSKDDISIAHTGVVTEMMWRILEVKNHANVRYLIQLFIVNILIRTSSPTTVTQLLVSKLNHSNYDYQIAASIIIISTSYLYHLLNQESPNSDAINQLFKSIIPWATDFHHAVRTCTQLAIHTIISRKYKVFEQLNKNEVLLSMYNYLETNQLQKRLREKQSLFIQNDDPLKQSLPSTIYTTDSQQHHRDDNNGEDNEDENNGGLSEKQEEEDDSQSGLALDEAVIPMSLLDIAKRLIKDFQSQFQSRAHQNQNQQQQPTTTNNNSSNSSDDIEIEDFQKRIIPWEQAMLQMEELVGSSTNNNSNIRPPRQSMIIVGTFIENTPNVAGLIRTSEIFNVEEVAIPNIKLLNDPQFQRVSVAADKWVPITEVNRQNLANYLKAKKASGYSILGVEQTSQSKNLATFQFPQKCLLLLGQEQNGIPAEYLELVDYCIEIPQLGVTRSLNVHVSASIVIWSYTQQQINKSSF